MLGKEEQLKGYEECEQTKGATTFVRLKKEVAAGVIAEEDEVQAAEPAAAVAPVATGATAAAVCPGEVAAATIPKEDEETPAGGVTASGEEDIAAAGSSLAQQLQQLQQRLSAMRWGSSTPLSHPQKQQQKQQQRQQENAGHTSSLSSNSNSNTGSAARSDSGSESEAEPETVGGIPAATSLGSLVMSLAASAANSVAEKIGQSAQQLFRPSGLFEVDARVYLCDRGDSSSALSALIPSYMDLSHPFSYLLINMSDKRYAMAKSCPAPSNAEFHAAAAPTSAATAAAAATTLDITTPRSASTATSSEVGSPRHHRQQQHQQQAALAYPVPEGSASGPQTDTAAAAAAAAAVGEFRTGTVIDAGFKGLPYPPLRLCLSLCVSAGRWLQSDSAHVLLLQCFRGLGRSACLAAAFLPWAGLCVDTAAAAAQIEDALGIPHGALPLLPSQRRFLAFFEELMGLSSPTTSLRLLDQPQSQQFVPRRLRRVILCGLPGIEEALHAFSDTCEGPRQNDSVAAAADVTAENQQPQVLLFRPVLEVWLEGSLVYSSLQQYSPPALADSSPPANGLKKPQQQEQHQELEAQGICCCRARQLPVYNPEEGSLKFDIDGVEACGDLLLRLLHVVPEQHEQEQQQQQDFWCCSNPSCHRSSLWGRKVPMARAAFHTASVSMPGCISFSKSELDGGPMLAAAFPDDCFIAAFFDTVEATQACLPGSAAADTENCAAEAASAAAARETRQLVERVRQEGFQWRKLRHQQLEQKQEEQEKGEQMAVPEPTADVQRGLQSRVKPVDGHVTKKEQQEQPGQQSGGGSPSCFDVEDWDSGGAFSAARVAIAAERTAAGALTAGENNTSSREVTAATTTTGMLSPWQEQGQLQKLESESDISWGLSDDEGETRQTSSFTVPASTVSPPSSAAFLPVASERKSSLVGQEGSANMQTSPAADGRKARSTACNEDESDEKRGSSGVTAAVSAEELVKTPSAPAVGSAASEMSAASVADLLLGVSSGSEEEGGLPVLGSRTRSISKASSTKSNTRGHPAMHRRDKNVVVVTTVTATQVSATANAPGSDGIDSRESSNGEWVTVASLESSPVLLASPCLTSRDPGCSSSNRTLSSKSSSSSGNSSGCISPKRTADSLFVLLEQQQQQAQEQRPPQSERVTIQRRQERLRQLQLLQKDEEERVSNRGSP
ncbi:hypothetical protein, conserved [Eimeria tenella]|uniref:C2 tensin-type domain-containing protein n=1 Tax=Eimeria tenella TaxID=5802 RepID=U6KQ17_EIMTE|nr:hypothetical protein, conserved [Eimeria tenella]CDJ37538.1 hypothetical protein, conserved [Eimeria tenella]|eukprot:XP_013228376.1 hypothetical protein, conserved [Eimeria tenella]